MFVPAYGTTPVKVEDGGGEKGKGGMGEEEPRRPKLKPR